MSTTTDKETAIAYSGVIKNCGTVFEITAGQIDLGASVSFLSQYPGEAEFLMPPLSCLEVRHPACLPHGPFPLPRGWWVSIYDPVEPPSSRVQACSKFPPSCSPRSSPVP